MLGKSARRNPRFERSRAESFDVQVSSQMSRSSRRQKLEAKLRSLEDQFSSNLVAALRECASGTWGMFGRNELMIEAQPKWFKKRFGPTIVQKLIDGGDEIERLRREPGLTEPFLPFRRFLEFREMRGSNAPGEPKLAVQFLEELGIRVTWSGDQ